MKKNTWTIRLEFEIPDARWTSWIDIKLGVESIFNLAGIKRYTWHISRSLSKEGNVKP